MIYVFKFLLFGLTYNVDPDLPQYYYPMVETLLKGDNPLNYIVYYNGGILWILILTVPSLIYNDVISGAIFIVGIYLVSTMVFYEISKRIDKNSSIAATQIYSLLPLVWFNVRDSQDDMFVALIFLLIALLFLLNEDKLYAIIGACSFYLKYFTFPYMLFLSISINKSQLFFKHLKTAILSFIIISLLLSYAFSTNILTISISNSLMSVHGLSFFVIFKDIGINEYILKIVSLLSMTMLLTFSVILVKIKKLDLISSSMLFFISIYAGMFWLTPWYFTWFISFFILYYSNKIEIMIPSLIAFDLAMRIWNIAENDLNHYKPLVYLSIFIVWTILAKCFVEIIRDKNERLNSDSSS